MNNKKGATFLSAAALAPVAVGLASCATPGGSVPASKFSAANPPPNDNLVVPGQRIGSIALGMSEADILQIKGTPQRTNYGSRYGSSAITATEYTYPDLWVEVEADNDNRVGFIRCSTYACHTASGLRVGSSALEIRARLGPTCRPPKAVPGGGLVVYTYPGMRINTKNGAIRNFSVVSTSDTCN